MKSTRVIAIGASLFLLGGCNRYQGYLEAEGACASDAKNGLTSVYNKGFNSFSLVEDKTGKALKECNFNP